MAEHEMNVDLGGGRQARVPVDYPSNSKRGKEAPKAQPQPKKVEQVTTGQVSRRKKGFAGRIGNSILSEGSEGVMQYVVMEVLVPAAKNMISDAISLGVERMLFGDLRPRSRADRPGGYVSYNRVRRPQAAEYGQHVITQRARAQHEFDDIILSTRGEAEEVLERLQDLTAQYDVATVADLYDLVGFSGDFTDNKWGWYDLRGAGVRHVRGGYMLMLPRTQTID